MPGRLPLPALRTNFQAMTLKTYPQPLSSQSAADPAWSPRSPAERIMMALKMHGIMSTLGIGNLLGTTGEAARQQLSRLEADGLVLATAQAGGVGRPSRQWKLTPKGEARFPDTHAALTLQLLTLVRTTLGEAALDAIIAAREVEMLANYEAALAGRDDTIDRVAGLADLRSAEGYMSGWREEPDGTLVLVENHCPICAAAAACQGFCRAELDVFQAVIGDGAKVTREEHIISGGRRCSYVIRKILP
jgi:predicted ArsR family transcriptional regulator